MFHAFGTRVELFEAAPRILGSEDEEVAVAVADALRESAVALSERFGSITWFDRTAVGVRMNFRTGDRDAHAEAALAAFGSQNRGVSDGCRARALCRRQSVAEWASAAKRGSSGARTARRRARPIAVR
jgi:hypothetical protein